MLEHDLLATSWTWAGDESIRDRVHAVGGAGFAGLSLSLDDLHEVRATTGFAELRRMLDAAGIVWVQLGPLDSGGRARAAPRTRTPTAGSCSRPRRR